MPIYDSDGKQISREEIRLRSYNDLMKALPDMINRKRRKLETIINYQEDSDRKYERSIAVIIASPPWEHVGPYCVDHIVPLKGITPKGYPVSGLNVPWNLQIITLEKNSWKGNRMSLDDYKIACSLKREPK